MLSSSRLRTITNLTRKLSLSNSRILNGESSTSRVIPNRNSNFTQPSNVFKSSRSMNGIGKSDFSIEFVVRKVAKTQKSIIHIAHSIQKRFILIKNLDMCLLIILRLGNEHISLNLVFIDSVNHHTGKEYYLTNQYFHDIKLHKTYALTNMLKHLEQERVQYYLIIFHPYLNNTK